MQTQELLDFVESEGETQDLMSASGLQSWETKMPAWWLLFRAFVAQPHNGGVCAALQSHFGGEVCTDLSPPSPCRVLAPWSSFQTTCRACFEVR